MRRTAAPLTASMLALLLGGAGPVDRFPRDLIGDRGEVLTLEPGTRLAAYRNAVVVLRPPAIEADEDRPKTVAALHTVASGILQRALADSRLFESIVLEPTAELPAGLPSLVLVPSLSVVIGSRLGRFLSTGDGRDPHDQILASGQVHRGRSKLFVVVEIRDGGSGRVLARYRGFGTGAGHKSITGGRVAEMAQQDLEKSYRELAALLARAMKP